MKDFLRKDFAQKCREDAPPEWLSGAVEVFEVLCLIREKAKGELRVISCQLHKRWKRRDKSALLSAFSMGLIGEPWVVQAIITLQKQLTEENAQK